MFQNIILRWPFAPDITFFMYMILVTMLNIVSDCSYTSVLPITLQTFNSHYRYKCKEKGPSLEFDP
jgi:hypothetical protein